MNFDFSDEQKQLRDSARRFLEKQSPVAVVRRVLEGDEGYDKDLWLGLAEMGFTGAAIPEEFGGAGLGYLELCVIAEELGRSLAPTPFSSTVYLAAEFLLAAGSEEQKQIWLPKIAAGEAIGAFAYAETAGEVTAGRIKASVSGGKLSGAKIPVADGAVADFAIVAAQSGSGLGLYIVDLNGAGVTRAVVDTIDPSRKHARIVFDGAPVEQLGSGDAQAVIDAVYDRAAVLTAFEQVGGSDRALEMARDYALERIAFGRQIGSFQAIKHMLADMYVSATLARSNCYWGAYALSSGSAELPEAAASCRISATKAFQHCATNNIQVHGGMGFTWQFDCHLYYKRSNLLALNLGSLAVWEDRLITRMRERNSARDAA